MSWFCYFVSHFVITITIIIVIINIVVTNIIIIIVIIIGIIMEHCKVTLNKENSGNFHGQRQCQSYAVIVLLAGHMTQAGYTELWSELPIVIVELSVFSSHGSMVTALDF